MPSSFSFFLSFFLSFILLPSFFPSFTFFFFILVYPFFLLILLFYSFSFIILSFSYPFLSSTPLSISLSFFFFLPSDLSINLPTYVFRIWQVFRVKVNERQSKAKPKPHANVPMLLLYWSEKLAYIIHIPVLPSGTSSWHLFQPSTLS